MSISSDVEPDVHLGDVSYSAQMEELLADDDETGSSVESSSSRVKHGYRDQLRDVLGLEGSEDDTHVEPESESIDEVDKLEVNNIGEMHEDEVLSDHTPSQLSVPSRIASPVPSGSAISPTSRGPFLRPTVSRLRSYTPQASRPTSVASSTFHSYVFDGMSRAPSHFSSISHVPSSNAAESSANSRPRTPSPDRDVFRWTQLSNIGLHIYSRPPSKAVTVLGSMNFGNPTVLAANGLICVGSDTGLISVFDFRQTLKCICWDESIQKEVGPVTALALSHDHTYVASGHATGYIQLYDLKNPRATARVVPPATFAAVSSGRKEGHLRGSRITSIAFIAGRHTALVSADEHGLSFFHSLGKVLFVEAPDVLRILGKYPDSTIGDVDAKSPPASAVLTTGAQGTQIPPQVRRRKVRYTVLAMAPLPLGTMLHPTDAYHVIALLTPTKLVVVGLKPTPRTWLRAAREPDEGGAKSRWRGCLAWFPSTESRSTPVLAYTWGNALHLLRVSESRSKEVATNVRTGKRRDMEVGRILFEDAGKWTAAGDILAIQWLNANQILVLCASRLVVYDTHITNVVERVSFESSALCSIAMKNATGGPISHVSTVYNLSHSIRTYKGKVFILGRDRLQVGTLLTWADRILTFVEKGDFLSAIELVRSYYVGTAPGNRNGLPEDPTSRREVVGQKMRELMTASAHYAFSEDRMTDGTHDAPDGHGVDRTSLFEELVSTCARACVALDDFDFLFEDLFQYYDDAHITRIFLEQLEPFVLNNDIRYVPPRITQRLVALYEEDSRPDHVERIIWHLEPECLDINQAIHLCQRFLLYDAMIYVYTRALRDYVSPIVQLLNLIRRVQQHRRAVQSGREVWDSELESTILNAYKVYPYLANVLSGLSYPSEEPMGEDEANRARADVYSFIFFGRSSVWPPGEGGTLVLTADEEGGVEPAYPYARQLLRFDAESFLHSLDIAFEDFFLTGENQAISHLVIVKILIEILSSGQLDPADVTFVNIFIARNVPKYPQSLRMASSTLHNILVGLAEDPNPSSREDRQLAAEYLLSVYNPHDSEEIAGLFEHAGFYRILRAWHRRERRWAPLISTSLNDPSVVSTEVFRNVDEVLGLAMRANKGTLPSEVESCISSNLPQLLQTDLVLSAALLDKHVPSLHEQAIGQLGDSDADKFTYLSHLLASPRPDEEEFNQVISVVRPSDHVPPHLRQMYIALACRFSPRNVIPSLEFLPKDFLDWDQVIAACEENEVYDAALWVLNVQGRPEEALVRSDTFEKRLTRDVVTILSSTSPGGKRVSRLTHLVEMLTSLGCMGVSICLEQSNKPAEVPLEDVWFRLLSSQISCVQMVSSCAVAATDQTASEELLDTLQEETLSTLRTIVQDTFASLVSITSTRTVSFPRLFTRLVDAATNAAPRSHYDEFRAVLTGMLESYRSDGDMLAISKRLQDRDLYVTLLEQVRARARGWKASRGICAHCKKPLENLGQVGSVPEGGATLAQIVVSRTGIVHHASCTA